MTTSQPPSSDPTEPQADAHLRAALRHAPDAHMAPGPQLSARILQAARAAASPPPQRWSVGPWLAQAWQALARPPLAAGMASLAVMVLVGTLWWSQPMDAGFERPVAEGPALPAPATQPSSAAVTTSTLASEATTTTADALARRTPSAPPAHRPAPSAMAIERKAVAAGASSARAKAADAAAPAAEPHEAEQLRDLAKVAAPAQTSTPAEAASPSRKEHALAEEAASKNSARRAAPSAIVGRLDAAVGTSAPQPNALSSVWAPLRAEPQRWTLLLNGQPLPAPGPAQWAALDQLSALTQGQWQARPSSTTAAAAAAVADAPTELRLLRDGQLLHTVVLHGAGLAWSRPAGHSPPGAQSLHAPLSDADAAAWRQALAQWVNAQ
jgi:hypothetical protein